MRSARAGRRPPSPSGSGRPEACCSPSARCSLVAPTDWKQPPIHTGPERVEALPWAGTLGEALARAKVEKKLVLVTVVAVSDDHWVSGYAGARQYWEKLDPPYGGDEVALRATRACARSA